MQASLNNISINYEIEGPANAPVVAFSHSLSANLKLWELQLSELRDSYRVLRFDTRGHGNSSAPSGSYTMQMLCEDAVSLLDHLGIEKTHFVGISMGGMIGQVLAVTHPERVDKLVLCDTTSRVPPEAGPDWEDRIRKAEAEGMAALAQQTLERWLSEEYRQAQPEMTERIRDMIVHTPVPGYVGCCRAISSFDVAKKLPKVTAPTLIIVGERDESTSVSVAEDIKRRIKGAELVVMPKALHLTNIETNGPFNQTLLKFLG